jgi:lathosterol oxidase
VGAGQADLRGRAQAIGTVLSLLVFVPAAAATLASGAIRFDDGWIASVVTFAVCWLAFQIFYYGLHRTMHGSTWLFRFHRWHHVSMVTTPMTGLSMHPVEALGWSIGLFGPGLLLSQLGLLGLGGWSAFFAVHFIGNIAGHANAEIFGIEATRTSSILANPIVYHSLHHARFDRHYGFAAAPMDRLFGTEWPDWLALHRKVMSGRPLESLREKCDD